MTGKQPFEAVVTKHGRTVLRVCRAVLGPADPEHGGPVLRDNRLKRLLSRHAL